MLRAKQRKVTSKTISSRPKRPMMTTTMSESSKALRKTNSTKWIILCVIIVFIISILIIINHTPNGGGDGQQNISDKSSISDLKVNRPIIGLFNKDNDNNLKSMNNGKDKYFEGLETIYISIATLGDHACPLTIVDIFTKAKYPHNLYVGIYQQNEGDDPDCLEMLKQCNGNNDKIIDDKLGDITILCKYMDHIVINRTNIKDGAKGPVYGRYMSMKLKQKDTDFICMIDSHTLFRNDWDEFTIKMWYDIEPDHQHAVLTHYPWGAEHLQKRIDEKNQYSYHICGSIYEGMYINDNFI